MKNKHVMLIVLLAGGLMLVQAQEGTIVQGNNLAEKLQWLNVFAQSNTSYIIELNAGEKNNYGWDFSYSGKSGITITLRGVGANRTISRDEASGGNFAVGSGVTLVLDNINIPFRNNFRSNVEVKRGGSLIMNNGSTINGGVTNGGTFTMNGGKISGNDNGVSTDTSTYRNSLNGGGVVVHGGTFTMNGGEISGNNGHGVSVGNWNTGSRINSGTFTMSGGTISGNKGGVVMHGGTFTMSDGTISGNTTIGDSIEAGVSVWSYGTFTMNGGTISGNKGTGVFMGAGTFTMSNGTISGNTASFSGGGVYVYQYGTFTKTGGTIYGYNASDTVNSNVVKDSSGAVQKYKGHAVYASSNNLTKIREGTAGPEDNMSFDGRKNPPTASGAWDN